MMKKYSFGTITDTAQVEEFTIVVNDGSITASSCTKNGTPAQYVIALSELDYPQYNSKEAVFNGVKEELEKFSGKNHILVFKYDENFEKKAMQIAGKNSVAFN